VKLFPTTLGFRKDVDFTQMDHTQLNPEERRIIGSRCTWEGLLDFNVRAVFRVYPPLNRNWLLSLQKTGWEPTWPSVGWEVILGKYACDDERKMFPHHYLQTLSTEDGKEGYVTVVYENQTILPTILANAPWIRAEIDTFRIQDLFVYEKDQIFLRVSRTLLELLTRLPPEKTMQFVPFASTSDSDSE